MIDRKRKTKESTRNILFQLVINIQTNPGITASQLCDLSHLNKGQISYYVKRLLQLHLICFNTVHTTQKGHPTRHNYVHPTFYPRSGYTNWNTFFNAVINREIEYV